MNWNVACTADKIDSEDISIDYADAENEETKHDAKLVQAARDAAQQIAEALGEQRESIHVELWAHETTSGEGFRPKHVTLTLSLLHPDVVEKRERASDGE